MLWTQKSPCTERTGVCNAERFGSHQSTHLQSGGVAASCWRSGEGYSPKPERLHNCFNDVFVVVIRHEIAALIQGLHTLWQGENQSRTAGASLGLDKKRNVVPMVSDPPGVTRSHVAVSLRNRERQRGIGGPEVAAACSGVHWRATADEDGHYCFAVAL